MSDPITPSVAVPSAYSLRRDSASSGSPDEKDEHITDKKIDDLAASDVEQQEKSQQEGALPAIPKVEALYKVFGKGKGKANIWLLYFSVGCAAFALCASLCHLAAFLISRRPSLTFSSPLGSQPWMETLPAATSPSPRAPSASTRL
jgi:hypothetical protein